MAVSFSRFETFLNSPEMSSGAATYCPRDLTLACASRDFNFEAVKFNSSIVE
jgi:hypothetical protein